MKYSKILLCSILALYASFSSLCADTKGKIEVAPSYIHIDIIQASDTVQTLDLIAVRAEAAYVMWKGLYLKPLAMYGKGKHAEFSTAGINLGSCIPLCDKFTLAPSIGINYSNLNATVFLDFGELGTFKLHENFEGWAPYISLELVYCIQTDLRLSFSGQYAWSRSETTVKNFFTDTSDAQGPAYALMLEYDFNPCWSVNIAGAYNESFSKQKNGIRGRGTKVGLVRWF